MDGWINIKEVLGLSLLSPYCIPNHSFKTVSVHAFHSSPSHLGLYKLLGKQLLKIWPTLTCQTHVPHLSHGATSQYKRTLHYCYCQLLLLLASALTDKIRFFNPDVQHWLSLRPWGLCVFLLRFPATIDGWMWTFSVTPLLFPPVGISSCLPVFSTGICCKWNSKQLQIHISLHNLLISQTESWRSPQPLLPLNNFCYLAPRTCPCPSPPATQWREGCHSNCIDFGTRDGHLEPCTVR